jgi:hypothetical protein
MKDARSKFMESEQFKSWLQLLSDLMADVRSWAEELDWATRQIEKTLDDSEFGPHKVPALLLQKETTRILLEPIARQAPGADGVVDLYLLPAYDDLASLYHHHDDGWKLHYMSPDQPSVGTIRHAESKPLSRENFKNVVEEMARNAV